MQLAPPDYPQFLAELKVAIRQRQYQALRARAASQHPKLQPLVREISWAKNLVILARCKDPPSTRVLPARRRPLWLDDGRASTRCSHAQELKLSRDGVNSTLEFT